MNHNSTAAPQHLLRIREVAERLGVCEDTIRNHFKRGTLRKITLSPRCVRVDATSLERLMAGGVEAITQ